MWSTHSTRSRAPNVRHWSLRSFAGSSAVIILFAVLLALPAVAAQGGSGGEGGGEGGGGTPGGGGGSGTEYSDLVLAYRDADGVPLMTPFTYYDPEEETNITEYCVQPVYYGAIEGLPQVLHAVNGEMVTLIPLMGETLAPAEVGVLAEDDTEVEVCDPDPAYLSYVLESELERLNMARTTDSVLDRRLRDVQTMLAAADGEMSLEASGRLMIGGVTVDSPGMNLAIYKALMADGQARLPDGAGGYYDLPDPAVPGYDWLNHASVAFAMTAGKEVPAGIDELLYFNRVARIMDTFAGDTLIQPQTKEEFVDYDAEGFTYGRAATFTGCVTYFPSYGVLDPIVEPIMTAVFDGDAGSKIDTAVEAAQRHADDARLVNLWFHDMGTGILDWDAPGENTCEAQTAAVDYPPTVTWTNVPAEIPQTAPTPVTAAVANPAAGHEWQAQLELTLDAVEDFAAADEVIVTSDGTPLSLTLEGGNLVGALGPTDGFLLAPGDSLTPSFDITVAETAPTGVYTLKLALEEVADAPAVWSPAVAQATTTVVDGVANVSWDSVPTLITQDTTAELTGSARNPQIASDIDDAQLRLIVDAPEDLSDAQITATANGETVAFTAVGGDLIGLWEPANGFTMQAGHSSSTGFDLTVAQGAPTGTYTLTFELLDLSTEPDAVLDAAVATTTVAAPDPDPDPTEPGDTGSGGSGGGGGGTPATPPADVADLVACPLGVDYPDFLDVNEENVHRADIRCAAWWGLTLGVDETHFDPAGRLTRGQTATFMVRLMEQAGWQFGQAEDQFSDDAGHVHEQNMNRLAAAEILLGKGDGIVDADGTITRGQFASLLVRTTEQLRDQDMTRTRDRFQDTSGHVHEYNIDKAAEAGLVRGYADGTYAPDAPVLREQMASMMMRLMQLLVTEGLAAPPA